MQRFVRQKLIKNTDPLCEVDCQAFFPFAKSVLAQGVEYPSCPVCSHSMKMIFQIDSEDHIPHIFGDVGTSHLSCCADHPDQLAFGWACC